MLGWLGARLGGKERGGTMVTCYLFGPMFAAQAGLDTTWLANPWDPCTPFGRL